MGSKIHRAARRAARRAAPVAGHLARPALCLSLLCQCLFGLAAPAGAQLRRPKAPASETRPRGGAVVRAETPAPRPRPNPPAAPTKAAPAASARAQAPAPPPPALDGRLTSARAAVSRQARVNFAQLSKQAARAPKSWGAPAQQEIHSPLRIREAGGRGLPAAEAVAPAAAAPSDAAGPLAPSPTPAQNYPAQEDSPKTGTTSFVIPPDTMGAVGPAHVFVNLNNNYRVQNKATGAPLSTVSPDTFWSATGAGGVFDPRVQYDPYSQRWLLAAVSNAGTANSSVLVAVSLTSDPQGTYNLYRFTVGCAGGAEGCSSGGEWADFPMLGFNKNWLAVSWNQFTSNTNSFVAGKMLVLDYPAARAGTAAGTIFTNASAEHGFCMHPATTFSATEETLYAPVHQFSAGALYRLHKITGTPSAPVFNVDETARVRPGGPWTFPDGNLLPQQCVAGVGAPTQTCPDTLSRVETQDAFIRSNVVFRNGKVWYPQTVALPAGGMTVDSRFAAQWTALNPDGSFADGGRVEDPSATLVNGGRHYSFASLAVNKNDDVLLGFSEFETDDYIDAGYTFRLGTDAAGAMRDPVIYKEGEDYYQKTFGSGRNRWGDYSHAVVDPANDRDMWTIQEYASLRLGATGQGPLDSRWGTWWARVSVPAGAGDLLISEFRLRGPNGANDEFVEIYNNSDAAHTVATADGSAGYAVVAQDNAVRCTIPAGTVIPARGHFLCVNSVGYSLAAHPAGNGMTATGDAAYTTDIPDNSGLALFRTATPADFTPANRLDAVGFTTTPPSVYVEGTGLPTLPLLLTDHSYVRDFCGKGGSITALGPCPTAGLPVDTNNNAADFYFVDVNGSSAGAGQRLGAPGPENLSSPVISDPNRLGFLLLDASKGAANPPNRVRNLAADPANNSTFGTLELRRRVVNNTDVPVTRLRFRIADLTTFLAPSGFADLRARTSTPVVVSGVADAGTCGPAPQPCTVTVQGTTLEEPPAQENGGGFNSTLSAGTVTLATPIPPGGSVNVRFLLGIQQPGNFKFVINLEVLP